MRKIIYKISFVFFLSLTILLASCKGGLYGKEKYTIRFITNGGNAISSQEVEWGNNFTMPNNPTKEGYSFGGWYLDEDFTNLFDPQAEKALYADQDITLYAYWNVNSYQVTFETNGGSILDEYQNVTGDYNSVINVPNPTKEGYIFEGWYMDNEFETAFDGRIQNHNFTVYAKWGANKMGVTFDGNGGTGTMKNQVFTNAKAQSLSLNEFKKEGHTFLGWAKTFDGEVVYHDGEEISTVLENKDIILYAVWQANQYDVKFLINSNESFVEPQKLVYNTDITFPTGTPERTGYTFIGWGIYQLTEDEEANRAKIYYKNNGTSIDPDYVVTNFVSGAELYEIKKVNSAKVNLNNVFYAVFEKNSFEVKFYDESNLLDTVTYYFKEVVARPANPEKEHYSFTGWYSDSALTTPYAIGSTEVTANINLYAKFDINKYDLTFNTNGGSSVANLIDQAYGTTIDFPITTKTGYTFAGWFSDSDLTNEFSDTTISESLTLFAKWTPNTNTAYTVNHNKETLSGGNDVYTENLTGTTLEKTNASFKEFEGFSSVGSIEQLDISPDGTTVINLYYTRNTYTVTFKDGDSVLASTSCKYEGNVVIPSSLTRVGYSYTLNYNEDLEFTSTTLVKSNLDVSVTYTPIEVAIQLVCEGAEVSDISQDFGSVVILPTPTKVGYTFDGWYIDNTFTTKANITTMPAEAIALYGRMIINKYTITIKVNDEHSSYGSIDITTINDVEYGKEFSILNNTFTINGQTVTATAANKDAKYNYSFTSWTNASGIVTDNITVIANFTRAINYYSVTFNENGGSLVEDITNQEADTAIIVPTITKTGYTFDGWYTDENLSVPYELNSKVLSDLVLYAKWSINSYKVSFNIKGETTFETIAYNTSLVNILTEKEPNNYYDNTTYYVFAGWKVNDTVIVKDDAKVSASDDVVYVAYFNEHSYTLKYQEEQGGPIYVSYNGNISFDTYVKRIFDLRVAYTNISSFVTNAFLISQADVSLYPAYVTPFLTEIATYLTYLQNGAAYKVESTSDYSYLNTLFTADINDTETLLYLQILLDLGNPDQDKFNTIISTSTSYKNEYSALYANYYNNAYNPFREDGVEFDGWKETVALDDIDNIIIYRYATWISPIKTVEKVKLDSISNNSITITWNPIEKAYGYKVYVNVNGVDREVETVRQGYTKEGSVVTLNKVNYVVNNINDGDIIKVKVIVLTGGGELYSTYREYSQTFTTSDFSSGASISNTPVKLDSIYSNELVYSHSVSAKSISVDTAGDYYYKDNDGVFYLFANSQYEFASAETLVITKGSEYANVNGNVLTTKSDAGYIEFELNGSPRKAYIRLLMSDIVFGDELNEYLNIASSDYLKSTKDSFTIGYYNNSYTFSDYYNLEYHVDNDTTINLYNGYRFNFEILTDSSIYQNYEAFDLEYKFEEKNGDIYTPVTLETIAIYDEEFDTFYFLPAAEGKSYRVTVGIKEDFEIYTNTTIPKAYKEDSAFVNGVKKSFEFTINNGANIASHESLYKAIRTTSLTCINIISDIVPKIQPNQVVYRQLALDAGIPAYLDDDNNFKEVAELDIVPNTAIMSTKAKGPKIWVQNATKPASGYYIEAKDGKYYTYSLSGTYAIESCEFKHVYDGASGYFKMISGAISAQIANDIRYQNYGLETVGIYSRPAEGLSMTINGNYYTVDGSKLPLVISPVNNSVAGVIANYNIACHKACIFDLNSTATTTLNNLTVISNTKNSSEYLKNATTDIDIAKYMEQTSGGFNGIYATGIERTQSYDQINSVTAVCNLNNINVYNALISLYLETGLTANLSYIHTDNTWANSLYGWDPNAINVTNSIFDESGAASNQFEDSLYYGDFGLESGNHTPIISIDLTTTKINNLLSGEEQYFKAYSMEVMALAMKSMIESNVSALTGGTMTIINKVIDPVTGLEYEKMNLINLEILTTIDSYNTKDQSDVGVKYRFGTFVMDTGTGYDLYVSDSGNYFLFQEQISNRNGQYVIVPCIDNNPTNPDQANAIVLISFESNGFSGLIQAFPKQ